MILEGNGNRRFHFVLLSPNGGNRADEPQTLRVLITDLDAPNKSPIAMEFSGDQGVKFDVIISDRVPPEPPEKDRYTDEPGPSFKIVAQGGLNLKEANKEFSEGTVILEGDFVGHNGSA